MYNEKTFKRLDKIDRKIIILTEGIDRCNRDYKKLRRKCLDVIKLIDRSFELTKKTNREGL